MIDSIEIYSHSFILFAAAKKRIDSSAFSVCFLNYIVIFSAAGGLVIILKCCICKLTSIQQQDTKN